MSEETRAKNRKIMIRYQWAGIILGVVGIAIAGILMYLEINHWLN